MATIGTGSPLLYVEGSASQISGSGNKRTVRITAKFKVNGGSSSYFGYACNWRARVDSSYGSWTAIKGTETWNGGQSLRTFTQDITVDVGTTSSKAITVGIYTDSLSNNSWDGNYTWSFKVGATNVAPVLSGTIATSPSGTIGENTGTIKVTSPAASDANNNLSGYKIQVSINGGGYSQIYKGSSREYNHNVSGYGQGTTFKYAAEAYDSANAYSSKVYSGTVTKNTFTGDTLASSSSVNSSSASLSFTYSGAKNTNGNTTFTRTLSCDGLTVYNPSLGASPATVAIYKSGAVPTNCYVKFDDIKNKFKASNYTGTLSFTLTTTNAYGTSKTSSKAISVDLRVNPNPATGATISTSTSESTIYKKVAFANNYYFLPDGSGVARVKWNAGSGNLGETFSYEVFVAYGSGSWQKVADVPSGTLYYNHVIPKQTVSQQFKYLIRTKSSYGYYSDATTSAQTLHYYNAPSITVGQINRTETAATIPVTVKSASSIPNISTVGTWSGQGSGSLTAAQTAQNISIAGLTGNGTYTITVVYNDNTGFSGNQSRAIAIGANLSIMFVNKYGLGVGGVKANASDALSVFGKQRIEKSVVEDNAMYSKGHLELITADKTWPTIGFHRAGVSASALYHKGYGADSLWIRNADGAKGRVYSEIFKPTASDVGARPSNWMPTAANVGAVPTGDVAEASTASKIPKRTSSGDINARLFKSEFANQTTISGAMAFRVNNSSDNFIRFCSDTSAIRNWIGAAPASHSHSYLSTSGGTLSGTTTVKTDSDHYLMRVNTSGQDMWVKALDTAGTTKIFMGTPNANYNLHLRSVPGAVLLRGTYVGCRNSDDSAYVECRASKFTVNSEEKWKRNIEEVSFSALEAIGESKIYSYDKDGSKEYGLIIGRETPDELIVKGEYRDDRTLEEKKNGPETLEEGAGDEFIDLYSMTSFSWKAIQELKEMNEKLMKRIEELEAK